MTLQAEILLGDGGVGHEAQEDMLHLDIRGNMPVFEFEWSVEWHN